MKVCVAQIKSAKGDINRNIEKHRHWINTAVSGQAHCIFFPELSLSGYEPQLAKALATDMADPRLDEFQELSNRAGITIGLGLPTTSEKGILISMLIFQPHTPRQLYAKQLLHADEKPYFTEGNKQLLLKVEHALIAPAICFESLQHQHAENAHGLGAGLYVASVAKSQKGIEKAMAHFPGIAAEYSMPVFMANSIGYCDNFESAGQSSVWDEQGVLMGQLDPHSEGILIYDTDTKTVKRKETTYTGQG